MDEEWTDWFQHDGKGQPVPDGTIVETVDRIGESQITFAEDQAETPFLVSAWAWADDDFWHCEIIRYRIRKPKALRELIDMIENLPVKEDA